MVDDEAVVTVWEADGDQWRSVGQVAAYKSLSFEPRHLQAGPWEMVLPYDTPALSILPKRLLSVDWRGRTLPLRVEKFNPATDDETGQPMLTVGGTDAIALVGRELAWPDPDGDETSQPASKLYTGNAESVIRSLISENYVQRYGGQLVLGTNGNRGSDIKARARFQNLLELVAKKAKRGGIGVGVEMVRTSGTRARLHLRIWEPADKTKRVRLTESAGTLRTWSQESAIPTATHELVGGAGEKASRVFRIVSTAKSRASADTWGGPVWGFIDGPDSFDNPELDQAGEEALDDAAETNTLTFTAAESEGLRAFRDYDVGDKATGELLTGLSVEDVITSIAVHITDDGVEVVPTFGDPDRKDPDLQLAQMIKGLRRQVRALERRR